MEFTPLNKWFPDLKHPLVVAGPCSAETREQVLEIGRGVAKIEQVKVFRAGIWKPRTRPNNFEGVGEEGLKWIKEVKEETGLLTTIEVANAKHAELALKDDIDIIWIGARTTVNPFSVQEIADAIKGTNIPVMVKNPINADLGLWEGGIERIYQAGIKKVIAIHRGFSTYEETHYRNKPIWKIPMELKRRHPSLPIICDPSHICGKRDLIGTVCQRAIDMDMDGMMVETHHTPDEAWSDAAQQVTPESLKKIVDNLSLKTEYSPNKNFEEKLNSLRGQIDKVDGDILDALKRRMDVVEQIGIAKVKNQVTALQVSRMDDLLTKRMERGEKLGLTQRYVKEIYQVIHDESVRRQTQIMKESES